MMNESHLCCRGAFFWILTVAKYSIRRMTLLECRSRMESRKHFFEALQSDGVADLHSFLLYHFPFCISVFVGNSSPQYSHGEYKTVRLQRQLTRLRRSRKSRESMAVVGRTLNVKSSLRRMLWG